MTDPEDNLHPQPHKAVALRAVLIALPLMVVNAFWLMANTIVLEMKKAD